MARNHARLLCSIWSDIDFKALTAGAQRLYILAISQPSMTLCGVVPFTPKRWSAMATDTTERKVNKHALELEQQRFSLVDPETEEMLVRSFVRYDGVLDSPNLVTAMWKDFASVHSLLLREVFLFELPEAIGLPEGLTKPRSDPLVEPFREGFPDSRTTTSPTPQPLRGSALEADFDEAWQIYPRRVDRGHAFRAYTARRNEGATAKDLHAAVEHYAHHVKDEPKKYIKYGKSFFSREVWPEWVDGPPDGERATDPISAAAEELGV